uniref:START domain-containing protein n=1 Tax=Chrysotila carterae TaxID=13221 RepID=A0A7S4F3E0_CHRCT
MFLWQQSRLYRERKQTSNARVLTTITSLALFICQCRAEGDGWRLFREEDAAGGRLRAETKESDQRDGVAFVRVHAKDIDVPVSTLTSTFLSPSLAHAWNPYMGSVRHLGANVQLQSYSLPWPFATREYLVHCTDEALRGGGHRSQCTPVASHPEAPMHSERVRGTSEALWKISPSTSDLSRRSDIFFEGSVDPGGALPKWLVNEIGKQASVNIVASLLKLAERRK